MTCILALEHEDRVYMGGDSASADNGWGLRRVRCPKVFMRGNFLFGYTTSFRMGQILEYDLPIDENESFEFIKANPAIQTSYLVRKIIPVIRKSLKNGGFTEVKDNKENGGSFLIGYGGRIFTVCSDFQVVTHTEGMDAVGCGADYALGALATRRKFFYSEEPAAAILGALEIAELFSAGVAGPFVVESV